MAAKATINTRYKDIKYEVNIYPVYTTYSVRKYRVRYSWTTTPFGNTECVTRGIFTPKPQNDAIFLSTEWYSLGLDDRTRRWHQISIVLEQDVVYYGGGGDGGVGGGSRVRFNDTSHFLLLQKLTRVREVSSQNWEHEPRRPRQRRRLLIPPFIAIRSDISKTGERAKHPPPSPGALALNPSPAGAYLLRLVRRT